MKNKYILIGVLTLMSGSIESVRSRRIPPLEALTNNPETFYTTVKKFSIVIERMGGEIILINNNTRPKLKNKTVQQVCEAIKAKLCFEDRVTCADIVTDECSFCLISDVIRALDNEYETLCAIDMWPAVLLWGLKKRYEEMRIELISYQQIAKESGCTKLPLVDRNAFCLQQWGSDFETSAPSCSIPE